jgi:hypothetical protein
MPQPNFIVLYNGRENCSDLSYVNLSGSFPVYNKSIKQCRELKVKIYNINYGHNKKLMEKCSELNEYAYFIKQIRVNKGKGFSWNESIILAIENCLTYKIMFDYLTKNKGRIHQMYTAPEEYAEYLLDIGRQEGRQEGREEGVEEGLEKGRKEEREKINSKIVQNLLFKGYSLESISDLTDIPLKEVEILKGKLQQNIHN